MQIRILVAVLALTLSSQVLASTGPLQHTLEVQGNKVALWEKSARNPRKTILLLHGRTYSSLPDFDLHVLDGAYSLMDALVAKGYAVYALDQPGYGASPRDKSGWFTPKMGIENVEAALRFISKHKNVAQKPLLFGWSLGSTMALLTAQKYPELVSDVIVFGYWRDLDVPISGDSVANSVKSPALLRTPNTREHAASDFVAPKTVVKEVVEAYVDAALKADPVKADPVKADLKGLEDFAEIDPKKIRPPVLILQGELDGASSIDKNAKLFTRLANPDRQWVIIAGGDHAAFLEKTKDAFLAAMTAFVERPR